MHNYSRTDHLLTLKRLFLDRVTDRITLDDELSKDPAGAASLAWGQDLGWFVFDQTTSSSLARGPAVLRLTEEGQGSFLTLLIGEYFLRNPPATLAELETAFYDKYPIVSPIDGHVWCYWCKQGYRELSEAYKPDNHERECKWAIFHKTHPNSRILPLVIPP